MKLGGLRIASFAALAVGVGTLFYSGFLLYQLVSFYRGAEVAMGEVVRIETRRGRYAGGRFSVYVFRDQSGRTWQGSTEYVGDPYRIGQSVPVLYDPKSPATSAVQGGWTMWMAPLFLCGVGVALTVSGWRNVR